MTFLNTTLLWVFLPLAAIPVILHLLTMRRLKTVELSTFRFLFDSYVKQRRRMKFIEILIAILRTLFLLILVLSIARPVVQHWDALFGNAATGRDVVLLIDGSASMAAQSEGETAMQRAKRTALQVVERLGSGDRVTVILVGARPEEVCSRFTSDAAAVREKIDNLTVTPGRANLFATFTYLFGDESRELSTPLIYLFSDLQTSGWTEFDDGQSAGLVPEGTNLVAVNVGSNQALPNRAVIGSTPEKQWAVAGLPIELRPVVANFSADGPETVTLSVFIDEKEIARKKLTVKPGSSVETAVIYTPILPGLKRGRYEIAPDRFPPDDRFQFTLNVARRVRVLIISGNVSTDPAANEALYLRTAMIATDTRINAGMLGDSGGGGDIDAQQELLRSLDVFVIREADLHDDILRDTDVVIMANCGKLAAAEFDLLSKFVLNGGGLMILPGDRVDAATYNEHLLPGRIDPSEPMVSASLGTAVGGAANTIGFGVVDFSHPICSVFGGDQRYLTKVKVYHRLPMQPADDPGKTWPLISFTDGTPAIVDSRFGRGRVLLSAFAFNDRSSNLPMRAEFVPLVLRMISHVKPAAELEGPSVVTAGGAAEIAVSQSWAPASATVTDVSERSTPMPLERSKSRLIGAFDRTMQQGFYTVDVVGGSDQNKSGTLAFAVNLTSGESDFTMLTESAIAGMLPAATLTSIDASAEAQQLHGSIGDEREVWRPLILLVFVIIGIEFFLSTLGGHVAEEDQTPVMERLRELVRGSWIGRMTGAEVTE
jgi:hypothetical protein